MKPGGPAAALKTFDNRLVAKARAVILILIAFAVYIPAMRSGFVWDDDLHVLNNIITMPDGLSRSWFGIEQPNFWPMTWTAFWAEFRLFGTDPTGYHVVSIAVHAFNSVLVWLVLAAYAVPGAWTVAVLFAIHPVNVETAAWITQLKTLLSMLFFLLSLLSYSCVPKKKIFYLVSVLLFLLSLLCKPATVAMPLVLLVLKWWQKRTLARRDFVEVIPFFLVAGIMAMVEIWFQTHRSIAGALIRTDSLPARIAGMGWAAWFYALKAIVPYPLMPIYPKWQIEATNPLAWVPLIALLVVLGVLFRTRFRPALCAVLYFLFTILPVLGLIDIFYMRYSYVADHYQYVSIVGMIVLGVVVAKRFLPRPAQLPLFLAICAVFAVLTVREQAAYRNLEAFYRESLRENPRAWLARNNLGEMLMKRGNLPEAALQLQQAMKIEPKYEQAYANYASLLATQGRKDEAAAYLKKASELVGGMFEPHNRIGESFMRLGRYPEAQAEFEKSVALNPKFAGAYVNLGKLHEKAGRSSLAIEAYGKAVSAAPGFLGARQNLAYALERQGGFQAAEKVYLLAIQDFPNSPELRNNYAAMLAGIGRMNEAISVLTGALKVNGAFAPTHRNLGALLARKNDTAGARKHLKEALRLDPRDVEAQAVLRQLPPS